MQGMISLVPQAQSRSYQPVAWVIAALLAALLAVTSLGVFAPSQAAAKPAWEYSVEAVPDLLFDESMAKLGQDGWELVFARRAKGGDDQMLYECIFKRPK